MKRINRSLAAASLLGLIGLTLFSQTSLGFFSHLDTADLLKPGEYQLGAEPQIIFNNYSGLNVIGHLDMGATDSSNYRFVLGTGSTVFQAGGFFKFVPIPDYANQPGIGGYAGLLYAYQNGISVLSLRVHPEISKKLNSDRAGLFTPYVALPFGISFYNGNTLYPFQIALGTKWLPSQFRHLNFWTELGLNLNSAFSYLSLGLTVPFDSWNDIRFN